MTNDKEIAVFRAALCFLSCLLASVLFAPAGLAQTGSPARAEQYQREGWKTDFFRSEIDLTEIRDGGPPKDGIPAIDDPRFASVANESVLDDREPVIPVTIGAETRAYPVRILMFHEIVNDDVGGVPVAVTYCPLCNAAIVFDRRLDGRVLEFGATGKLRHSDLVMYDRQTETWWQQFTGQGLVGELAGRSLDMIPTGMVAWSDFRKRHPEGHVLQPPKTVLGDYGRNPYVRYDSAAQPFLYDGQMPEDIGPMERVVLVRDEAGKPVTVVTMNALREAGAIERNGYTVSWSAGQASALDAERIAQGRDVGNVRVTGAAGRPALHEVTFAFVAYAFYPDLPIR
ncbi:DUF3179 domain-containing protein [Fulvimarina sp. MAC8]